VSAAASSVAASGPVSLAAPPPPAALAAARRRQAGSLASVVPFVSAPDPLSRPHPHADAQQPDVAPVDVHFPEIYEAASRIRAFVPHTECHHSQKVSKLLGARVFFKNEFALPTGSFKERGGRNALMQLSADAARRGVIAASAGNHALALAYHGGLLGVPVTVIMPVVAPMTKVQNCRDLGATVVSHGAHIGEAREMAARIGEERGLTYINGFDHVSTLRAHVRARARTRARCALALCAQRALTIHRIARARAAGPPAFLSLISLLLRSRTSSRARARWASRSLSRCRTWRRS
jgi:hypothetical protein